MAKGERIALGEVAEINPPIPRAAVDDPGMEVSFVGMSGVSEVTASVLDHDVRTVAECRKGYTAFQRGDVLVAKITPCFENGKIVMADIPHAFGFGSTEFHVIRPRPDKLDPRFLLHFLRVPFFRVQGERRMTGSAGQRRVPANFLSTFDIPLPPLLLQRRIAEVLDKAEALRAKRRAALAQLDSLTQSLFLDLLSKQAGKELATVSIEDGMEAIIDYRGKSPRKTDRGIPLVTARVVKGGELLEPNEFIANEDYDDWMRRGFPKKGDVLFTTEAPLGEVAQLDGRKVALAQRLIVLRGKSSLLDNTFLMHAMTAPVVRDQINARATGSTVRGIRQQELRKVMLPVPPIDLQREFARRVAAVEKLKTAQRAALAELDALFASLQHRAFRGEL